MPANFSWGCFGAILEITILGYHGSDHKHRTECPPIFPGAVLVPSLEITIFGHHCSDHKNRTVSWPCKQNRMPANCFSGVVLPSVEITIIVFLTVTTEQNARQFFWGLFWCHLWRLPFRAIIFLSTNTEQNARQFVLGLSCAICGDYHRGPSLFWP